MSANEYLTYTEWARAVNHLCIARLAQPITEMPEVTSVDMENAWREGVTPEEFYNVDVMEAIEDEKFQAKAGDVR